MPGELPTIEDITLQTSVEDIVLAGTGRITKWSRVRLGAGGLDAKLVLDNDYLRILDLMSVGQEEWEVVAALRSTKTVAIHRRYQPDARSIASLNHC